MTKMEKLVLFLTFYMAPPFKDKKELWDELLDEEIDVNEDEFFAALIDVSKEQDDYMNWNVLGAFKESLLQGDAGASEGVS